MFALVADNFNNDIPDLADINRSYVLMVAELKKLYERKLKRLTEVDEQYYVTVPIC
jgi:hypothetical protein